MDNINPVSPMANDTTTSGTKDGSAAADNDQPYRFGRRPNVQAPYPFNDRQFARLLILKSRLQAAA
ncbi:MAG TPA: hypothetical protein VGQ62_22535 [Chloroflexota bacterium]|jgi:uncharacterized Fe-S cluster-containing radical SAM superfamily enzyme|nr:hypothetical protein [Chloroflexota bacterium]